MQLAVWKHFSRLDCCCLACRFCIAESILFPIGGIIYELKVNAVLYGEHISGISYADYRKMVRGELEQLEYSCHGCQQPDPAKDQQLDHSNTSNTSQLGLLPTRPHAISASLMSTRLRFGQTLLRHALDPPTSPLPFIIPPSLYQ